MKINTVFDPEKYYLIPVTDPKNFKREVMKIKFERQAGDIQKQLGESEGKSEWRDDMFIVLEMRDIP